MTIGTLKSPNPRNRNGISVIKLKFLSVSSMNTLLAILKVSDARRDVILAGGLDHRFPWRHPPLPPPPSDVSQCQMSQLLLAQIDHTLSVIYAIHINIYVDSFQNRATTYKYQMAISKARAVVPIIPSKRTAEEHEGRVSDSAFLFS